MANKYQVYAEDMDGNRRYLDTAMADNGGNGLFALYSDECGDEEQIVIVPQKIVRVRHCPRCGREMIKNDKIQTPGVKVEHYCDGCGKTIQIKEPTAFVYPSDYYGQTCRRVKRIIP